MGTVIHKRNRSAITKIQHKYSNVANGNFPAVHNLTLMLAFANQIFHNVLCDGHINRIRTFDSMNICMFGKLGHLIFHLDLRIFQEFIG